MQLMPPLAKELFSVSSHTVVAMMTKSLPHNTSNSIIRMLETVDQY